MKIFRPLSGQGNRGSAVAAASLCAFLLSSFLSAIPASAQSISFFNESDPDKAYKIPEKDPATIATITLEVKQPSLVLVQFTSHVTTEDTAGCPARSGQCFRAMTAS